MSDVSPQGWKSSVEKPADFDAFWEDTLARTDDIPLDPQLEPMPMRTSAEVEVFEAHYRSYGGLRIAGWYCRPRGASDPLPGLLIVPGYAGEPPLPSELAAMGYAVFSAAPRGKLRSNAVFNPGYPGLLTHDVTDRDNYGYRGFYMDALRAFDFLAGLPEVDAERIGVRGSSQGDALTFARRRTPGRPGQSGLGRCPVPVLHDGCGLADPLLPLRRDQRLPPPVPGTQRGGA